MFTWSSMVDQLLTNPFLDPTDLSRVDNDGRADIPDIHMAKIDLSDYFHIFLDLSIDGTSMTPYTSNFCPIPIHPHLAY